MPESCHSESTWKFKNRMFFSIEGKEVFLFSLKSTFCSVVQSCLTLGNPMDCSTPGFPVLHHLPEFVQTHVGWVGDAIQPSSPLPSPSPPFFFLIVILNIFFLCLGNPLSLYCLGFLNLFQSVGDDGPSRARSRGFHWGLGRLWSLVFFFFLTEYEKCSLK